MKKVRWRDRQESMFSSHKDTRQQIKIRNVSENVEEWEGGERSKGNSKTKHRKRVGEKEI
jgi:hypothetical protein